MIVFQPQNLISTYSQNDKIFKQIQLVLVLKVLSIEKCIPINI